MSEIATYTPPAEVAATDPTGGRLVAWAAAASAAHQLAKALSTTAFVPKHFQGNASDATAAIILGDELGLSPISALRSIYVIGGQPALYARTMVALVMSHGHRIWTVEDTPTKVTVAGQRRGSDRVETVTWTTDRARKAGYTSNRKYDTDPQSMLYARAAGDVARRIAPDVLAGVPYSAEEIELADIATVTVTRENKPRTVTRQPPPAVEEPPMDDAAPEPATRAQITRLNVTMKEMGIEDRETKLAWLSDQIGRVIASSKEMTKDEASRVLDRLENPEPPEPGWVA
jgi:hypothetical protein